MPAQRLVPAALLLCLAASACGRDRVRNLEIRLQELGSETERLRRDLDDLRRRGAGGGAAAPAGDPALPQKLEQLEAFHAGLLENLSASAAAPRAPDLHGVWRTTRAERARREAEAPGVGTAVEQVVQYAPDGRLCGWAGRTGGSREPFAGRWELRGAYVVETRDEWNGARNVPRVVLREVGLVDAEALELRGPQADRFSRVAPGDWAGLRSLRDDRMAPIGGLQPWCFQ